MVGSSLLGAVVQPDLPVTSVKELIALARARPGELNYASSGGGSASNLGAVLFQSLAGVRMTSITYKGAAQSLSAVVAGEIQPHIQQYPAGHAAHKERQAARARP